MKSLKRTLPEDVDADPPCLRWSRRWHVNDFRPLMTQMGDQK